MFPGGEHVGGAFGEEKEKIKKHFGGGLVLVTVCNLQPVAYSVLLIAFSLLGASFVIKILEVETGQSIMYILVWFCALVERKEFL